MPMKINEIPRCSEQSQYLAIDTEWFGMNKKQLHRPTSGRFGCLSMYDGNDVYIITEETLVPFALNAVNDSIWVMHRAQFDIVQLRRLAVIPKRKKLWDTMIIERLLWGNYYDSFGLADLARRYLDVKMDKSLQKAWEKRTHLDDDLLSYAAEDVRITYKIREKQIEHMTKTDMKIWQEIDRPALFAVIDFCGFRIDTEQWEQLAERNKQRQKEIDDSLPINPRSPKQVTTFLRSHGFKGLKNSQEETLAKAIRRYPKSDSIGYALRILQSRKYGTYASTYGTNLLRDFVETINDDVQVIYPEFEIIGAETGRMSSSSPNIQNIPWKDTKEFRKCFIARTGNKLLIADYSAQEPRIGAYMSQDKKLIGIFESGDDIYCAVRFLMYKDRIDKSDPIRKTMKAVVLGAMYGLTAYGLSSRENIPLDDAEKMLNDFFKTFPQFNYWASSQRKNKRYVQTASGRKIWINPYSSQAENNTINSPIQGTAADMMKRAFGKLYTEHPKIYICAVVHDELITDDPEPLHIAPIVRAAMLDAANYTCPGMPFEVSISIGDTWADKD